MQIAERLRHHEAIAAALAALGAVTTLLANGSGWLGWALAAGLALLGAWAWVHVRRGIRAVSQQVEASQQAQQALGTELLPVWSGHLESARGQMETAVSALAQRFGGIVQQVQQTARMSDMTTDPGGSLGAAFASGENKLGEVVTSLKTAMADKAEMLGQIKQLQGFIGELQAGLACEQEIPALAGDMQQLLANLMASQVGEVATHAGLEAASAAPLYLANYGKAGA